MAEKSWAQEPSMDDYVKYHQADDHIQVWFYNEYDKPLQIGETMQVLNDEAYMNGYNWDALFNYYLSKHAPELLQALDSDPEAGSYVATYPNTAENLEKAKQLVTVIRHLIENETELYRIVQEEADQIEWD